MNLKPNPSCHRGKFSFCFSVLYCGYSRIHRQSSRSYSDRSASTGLRRAARMAGTTPAANPINPDKISAAMT